jgi:hypothetical protein
MEASGWCSSRATTAPTEDATSAAQWLRLSTAQQPHLGLSPWLTRSKPRCPVSLREVSTRLRQSARIEPGVVCWRETLLTQPLRSYVESLPQRALGWPLLLALDSEYTPRRNKDRKSHPSHLNFIGRGRQPAWQRPFEAAIGSRMHSTVAWRSIRAAGAVLRDVAGASEDGEELHGADAVNARSPRWSSGKES